MEETNNTYFYVDPMGFKNLSLYDVSLLTNIDEDIEYFTSIKFEYDSFKNPTHKIYSYSDKKGIKKILSYFLSQRTLWRAIKKMQPQVIHFQWFKLPWLDLQLVRLSKRQGAKIVFTAHNLLPHDSGNSHFKVFKKIYNEVDKIIVHSDKSKKELTEKFDIPIIKIETIPHGLLNLDTLDKNRVLQIKNAKAREFGLENKTVFSFLGGINYYKGIDVVIETWNQVHDNSVHLLIAGKGGEEYLDNLKKKDNVTLINRFLENEEFEAYLELSDYILLPYRQISQSGVLLSALNKRKKVIVTNKGGLTDPFLFGDIGIILNELNPNELSNAIQLAKHNNSIKIDDSIWKNIEDKYDWKKIGKQTQELYKSII